MIPAPELQTMLRQVAQLSGVEVKQLFPALAPWVARVSGAISIHGAPYFWETDIDLRGIEQRADFAAFVGSLLDSFDVAASR